MKNLKFFVLFFFLLCSISGFSQRVVKGKIVDIAGIGLPSAAVTIKGEKLTAISEGDGTYTINIPENIANPVLVFAFVGFKEKQITVGNNSTINVTLEEDVNVLDDLVVTALGIKREQKALGYSVQQVKGDAITAVKGTNIATSLTGKIAGVNIRTSTDFFEAPTIVMRGASPIIVIDGVLSRNITLRELAPEDIESFEFLKGGTAGALYGEDGRNGAIMITTKRASVEGVKVSVSSNTMFHSGFLRLPEVQTSYSSGYGGKYNSIDNVWGDKMDIGKVVKQYNPLTNQIEDSELVSKGKDNLNNFMETSFVTNNNVNVEYKGKQGSFRTSLSHVYNKGVFPNNKENRISFTTAGNAKISEKVSMDASFSYNKRFSPQIRGNGYGWSGYIYNMLVWTGSDYDVRDYKQYWKHERENVEQNWHYAKWYNNPYFLANETLYSSYHDRVFGKVSVDIEATSWLKFIARTGYDGYFLRDEQQFPMSHRSYEKGQYTVSNGKSANVTADFLALADYSVGDFDFDGLLGTTISFREINAQSSSTKGGLSIPGYYSLAAGLEGQTSSSSVTKYRTNSLYGKIGVGWKHMLFLEATGRNDWSSTLDKENNSFFYPSIAASFVASEIIPMPSWIDFWKLRGSWTQSKSTPGYNEINRVYTVNNNVWDGSNGATHPTTLRPSGIKPQNNIDWEVGTEIYFLKKRVSVDFAHYQRIVKDRIYNAPMSGGSGWSTVQVNLDEETVRRGFEVTINAKPVITENFQWITSINWSRDRIYYKKLDPEFAIDRAWVYKGAPTQVFEYTDWQRDPQGNLVLSSGKPFLNRFPSIKGNKDPDWIWGFANTFVYKNFTLNVSFDGRVGGYGWDQTSQALWHSGAHRDSDTKWRYDEVVNGNSKAYIGEGVKVVSGSVEYDSYGKILSDTRVFEKNDVPISYEEYMTGYHSQPSGSIREQWINKMTFFKLRELSLSYKIPKTICEKIRLSNAEIAFVGQNLFIWSKNFKFSDPDGTRETAGLITPSVRYLGFNVKFDF